MKGRTP